MTTTNLPRTPRSATVASFTAAAVLTLAMLLGVNTLATSDAAAPQLAQASTSHA